MKAFERTQAFLASLDICQFSRSLTYPRQLAAERRKLVETIRATDIIERALAAGHVTAQFVGDEMRLAFLPSAISEREIETFIRRVFEQLDEDASESKWGPTVRAALVQGPLVFKKHPKLLAAYFEGPAVETLNNLLAETNEGYFSTTQKTTQLSARTISGQPEAIELLQTKSSREYILALGLPKSGSASLGQVLDIMSNSVDSLNDQRGLRFSVGLRGVLAAIPDGSITRVEEILTNIKASLELLPTHPAVSAAVTYGELWPIESPWYEQNFEGPAAIVAARIVAQAEPYELLWQSDLESLMRSGRPNASYREALGKRGEAFRVGSQANAFLNSQSVVAQRGSTEEIEETPPKFGAVSNDTALQEFLAALALPVVDQAALLNEFKALARHRQFAACAILAAFLMSGLIETGRATTSSDATQPALEPSSGFLLGAAHATLTREFGIWKQFHSTAGDLTRYCKVLIGASEAWDSSELAALRSAIRKAFSILAGSASVAFDEAIRAMDDDGCKPLAGSYQLALRSVEGGLDLAILRLASMDCADIVSWAKSLESVLAASEELRLRLRGALVVLGDQIDPLNYRLVLAPFDDLLTNRIQASQVSFELAAALLALNNLLGLSSVGWKREEIGLSDLVIRRSVAEALTLLWSHPDRVVILTNKVLFAWIGLFRYI